MSSRGGGVQMKTNKNKKHVIFYFFNHKPCGGQRKHVEKGSGV